MRPLNAFAIEVDRDRERGSRRLLPDDRGAEARPLAKL